jgi:hypothetical protein
MAMAAPFFSAMADCADVLHVVQKDVPTGGRYGELPGRGQPQRTASCVRVDEKEGAFLQGGEHHPHRGRIRGKPRSHVIVGTGCLGHGGDHAGHFLSDPVRRIADIQGVFARIPVRAAGLHGQMEENLPPLGKGCRCLLRGERGIREKG